MRDAFSSYNPIINLIHFASAMLFSMFFMHPVCLALSFLCAFAYYAYLNGKKALRTGGLFMLPMLLVTALVNPAFNHEGVTILLYLRDGNPLTLESIVYGIAAALMLISIVSWFGCCGKVMTSDKLVYLFGGLIPALSLVLSMALRFVPRFKSQIKVISDAQKCVGRDVSNGNVLLRARHGIRIVSIMVTWALENAIETADSMKCRGYGLPGRTAFSVFRFDRRDFMALLFMLACDAYIVAGALAGGLYFRYFPSVAGVWGGLRTTGLFAVCFALYAMPVAINLREDAKWKALEAKIQPRAAQSSVQRF
ncbi:MAG: energy-coupling factor transporter transmembrane protein EcfT [Clostridiales Family XIII bacterium]|jgi:energy-coupling factor transport system permease protein|nr:energy-coupling factor transporter transmembrane protein EcfT [Clostridiales Family XIII bacterium]